jgi:hypothetical protein
MPDAIELLWRLLLLAAIGALVWWVTRPKFDFTIRVSADDVSLEGRIVQAKWGDVARFLRALPHTERPIKISGRRRRDGRLLVDIRGPIDAGQKQRIRNFLVETL